ncbi:MAG TPA: hypothetical protein VK213_14325 [Bacteroidales bacterium]|nr:hypothetical protein [Bacteroidales bacterium]
MATQKLILSLAIIFVSATVSYSQSERNIPVYPGATLKTGLEQGDSEMCCSFKTSDSFDKVVSFYENALKLKSVDPNGLASQFPDLKDQVKMMLDQMPAGARIKFFILNTVEFMGKKGAETFEVVYTPAGVTEFSIMDSQFSEEDLKYADEWNMATSDEEEGPAAPALDPGILAEALPGVTLPGYERSELNINADGFGPASVGIDMSKPGVNINITIYDNAGFMEGVKETITPSSDNQKAVTVKGRYPGKETLTAFGNECGGADKIFLVKDRYLVIISTMNMCDFNVINKVVDMMNVDRLP